MDSKDSAIDLRTKRYNVPDNVGIIRRFMHQIVLPKLPAIQGPNTEQYHQETVQDVPGVELPASLRP